MSDLLSIVFFGVRVRAIRFSFARTVTRQEEP